MQSVPQPNLLVLFVVLFSALANSTHGFQFPTARRATSGAPKSIVRMAASQTETTKQIYGVRGSGWRSQQWNWGYAQGTGHDCAAICRERWSARDARRDLVQSLLSPATSRGSEVPFAEVTLVLGLAWQNGRWDGSDGGPEGYPAVLRTLVEARRYEEDDEVLSARHFIEDVNARFETISRDAEELARMRAIASDVLGKDASTEEVFSARRSVAGMVLDAMGFVEKGL